MSSGNCKISMIEHRRLAAVSGTGKGMGRFLGTVSMSEHFLFEDTALVGRNGNWKVWVHIELVS